MVAQKQRPSRESITRLRFSLSKTCYPFVAASTVGKGTLALQELLPRKNTKYGEFCAISKVIPDRVLALTERYPFEAHLITRYEFGGLFELVVSNSCPVIFLCKRGAVPCQVTSSDGKGFITAELLPETDTTAVIRAFTGAYTDAELVYKRQQSYSAPPILLPGRRTRHRGEAD